LPVDTDGDEENEEKMEDEDDGGGVIRYPKSAVSGDDRFTKTVAVPRDCRRRIAGGDFAPAVN
jgi:hypothetical protein